LGRFVLQKGGVMLRFARYYGDFFIVPLMVMASVMAAGPSFATEIEAVSGFFIWTFIEYTVHRMLHDAGGAPRKAHEPHHAEPECIEVERSSLTTPLIVAPAAIGLIALLGQASGCGVLAGLLVGYLAFITVHHAVHRWKIYPDSFLYAARRRHALHHHRGPGNYGVTTSLWDVIFNTYLG
jgi:sterol desaturase/sphingolipid hydroxylase (fatty acid hydroxylase superfamily)